MRSPPAPRQPDALHQRRCRCTECNLPLQLHGALRETWGGKQARRSAFGETNPKAL